ncbi:GrpE protein 2 [Ranunculus cassubicifolius]
MLASKRLFSIVVISRNNLKKHLSSSLPSNVLDSSNNKTTLLSYSILNTTGSRGFWFSSSASPEPAEKEAIQPDETTSANGGSTETTSNGKATETIEDAGSASKPEPSPSKSVRRRRQGTKRTAFSDSDVESDLSTEDLVKLVAEKEEALKLKHKEIEKMNDKVLRTYADMENLMERTKREAENSKKIAVQNFAKSLLDVADNLGRASSVVKDGFSKVDTSKDTVGAVPLLKTLLEGVEMTDKQLLEVFRKFGLEKYDPINEQFDPNRHNAVFQMPDASKPAGTVASVLKPGYMLHDRVIRPAEVGVAEAPNSESKSEENSSVAAAE